MHRSVLFPLLILLYIIYIENQIKIKYLNNLKSILNLIIRKISLYNDSWTLSQAVPNLGNQTKLN